MAVVGVLLAAGAGRRMGGPKALLRNASGESLLVRATTMLYAAGCPRVVVVLGAAAERGRALLAAELPGAGWLQVVETPDWADGMGASLRAGLLEAAGAETAGDETAGDETARDQARSEIEAVLVTLVDLPDVTAAVARRVLAAATSEAAGREVGLAASLARAAYRGVPGHPVLLGRDHWPAVRAAARGDQGAREVFTTTGHRLVECGDLATGRDVDRPEDRGPLLRRPPPARW